jgi:hypothetical protein
MKDEVKKLAEQLLRQAQEAVAQDVAAQLYEDQAKLIGRAAQVASETIDMADKLAADGNPHKQQIAEIVRRGVLGGMGQVASGRVEPQEERVPLEENPFSGNSSGSVTDSRGSQTALTDESNDQESKAQRGRPKGSKNRPKP